MYIETWARDEKPVTSQEILKRDKSSEIKPLKIIEKKRKKSIRYPNSNTITIHTL